MTKLGKKLRRGTKGVAAGRAETSISPSKRTQLRLFSWRHSRFALLHFEEKWDGETRIVSSYASRAALAKLREAIDRHLAEMPPARGRHG